jgi:ribosomal protein S18 acetylase RimI-like enzyme
MRLPDGLTARPATAADADAIYRLIAACERDLDGVAEVEPEDIVADLARPALDLARDTVLVRDPAGGLVGWAHVFKARRAEADVHPGARGRGIGAELLAWTEARAAEQGGTRVGQTVTDHNKAAAALFESSGYRPTDTAWILEIAMDEEPEAPDPPTGISIRPYAPGRDDAAAYRLIEDAFNEWPDRLPSTFEEWHGLMVGRETFLPELSPLAFDRDRLVGAVLALSTEDPRESYIHQVATHRDYRHRGIARTLLRHAFRGFYRAGSRSCTLSTNSYTGALSLYERVGMRIRRSYMHYEKALTA